MAGRNTMKIRLIIDCEDREEAQMYLDASKNQELVSNVWDELFRPRHKYGHSKTQIKELLELSEKPTEMEMYANKKCNELMDYLEDLWHDLTL
jgi:hypothetical protein